MDVRHVETGEVFTALSTIRIDKTPNGPTIIHGLDQDGCVKCLDEFGEVRWIKGAKLEEVGS